LRQGQASETQESGTFGARRVRQFCSGVLNSEMDRPRHIFKIGSRFTITPEACPAASGPALTPSSALPGSRAEQVRYRIKSSKHEQLAHEVS
jgi:hypothetical protein